MGDRLKYFSLVAVILPLLCLSPLPTIPSSLTAQAQTPQDRTDEAERIYNLGRQKFDGAEYPEALKFYEQALVILREIKYRQGEAVILNEMSAVYRKLGQYPKAIEILEQALVIIKQTGDRAGEGAMINNIGLVYRYLGQYDKALEYFQQALAITKEVGKKPQLASILSNIGSIYDRWGKYAQALELFQQALAINQEIGDQPRQANVFNDIGSVYQSLGDYTKALQFFQQAYAIDKELGYKAEQGINLNNIGLVYQNLAQYPKALEFYQQALAISKQTGDIALQSTTLNNIGLIYNNLAEYTKALDYYQQSLAIDKQIGNQAGQGVILNNIGAVYRDLGQYAQSLEFLQQALAIRKQIGDKAGEGTNIGNIGEIYRNLGQYPQALQQYQQALVIQQQIGDKAGEATTRNNIGETYRELKEYDKALEYLQPALALRKQIGDKEGEGQTLNNIGELYRNLEKYDRALEYFQQSLAINQQIGDKAAEAGNVNNIGEVYRNLEQYAKALDYFQQALAIVRKIGDKVGEAKTLNNIGLIYNYQSQYPEAEKTLFAAVEIWESLRPGLTDAQKISLFENQTITYRSLQQSLVNQNKINSALEVADRARARAFVELLASKQLEKPNAQLNIKPLKLPEIQNIAKQENATLVQYSTLEDKFLYIWVVKPTGEISFAQVNLYNSLKSPLQNLVLNSRRGIGARGRGVSSESTSVDKQNQGQQKSQLNKLYDILIQPIAQYLPTDPKAHIVFIPQESLFLVPFPALQDDQGKYLIEKHTILTAPAIQVLDLTRKHRQNSNQSFKDVLVVGNPTMPKLPIGNEQLPPLPGAEEEAIKIAELLKTPAIIGNKATETAMVEKMKQANIIHFATHGLLDDFKGLGVPGAIALAPGGKNDGLLTSSEILDMKLKAELVVLSACNTGGGNITGDGVIGLSRSLITAGAKSVIVSLWSVPDNSTALLMTEFYRQLQHNSDKAAALRQAMLTTRQQYSNPVDWAAFTLIGEAE
ncbi:CHAT domain-containing tetratricopeptide repeat protein [Calothrix sp. NIES-2098]|uniref:CHAT domain-containing tetratricopeptide repeat protein n=1 Tax=Calothrix sp. NIES-2098 TaxID=1954171 RepID=UPI000B60248A|nr:TPR repeat-containing protein [Calothrix sp. NIES-2098]